MSRLTSKYQLTLPKAVAKEVGIQPGDELDCEPAGEVIRVRATKRARRQARSTTEKLTLFDLATERIRELSPSTGNERGWTRDELYKP